MNENNLKYYVLGKKGNSMLEHYLEKYIELIIQRAKLILKESDSNKLFHPEVNYKYFLSHGDISSLINALYLTRDSKTQDETLYKKLQNEIDYYVSGNEHLNIFNKGAFIAGTNIRLTTHDYNPYNVLDAHPDHKNTGGILGWGEMSESDWIGVYDKTFNLLKSIDEGFYDELNKIINKIVPLGTSINLHNSASYKESIGHLYMGYTLGIEKPEISNLEAVIHESSHNKLNILFHFDDIILNDLSENYYSPFRPDARHLKGVFLAIHAFVPTIYVLIKAFQQGDIKDRFWLEKIVLFYIKNKITWKVLRKYARFSELGEEIMSEVQYVMQLTDKIFHELNVDKKIISTAINKQKEHFENVNKNYPNFKY